MLIRYAVSLMNADPVPHFSHLIPRRDPHLSPSPPCRQLAAIRREATPPSCPPPPSYYPPGGSPPHSPSPPCRQLAAIRRDEVAGASRDEAERLLWQAAKKAALARHLAAKKAIGDMGLVALATVKFGKGHAAAEGGGVSERGAAPAAPPPPVATQERDLPALLSAVARGDLAKAAGLTRRPEIFLFVSSTCVV